MDGGAGGIDEGEGAFFQVDRDDVFGDDARAVAFGLVAHVEHKLGAHNAFGKAGEVFDFGGEVELAEGKGAFEAVVLGNGAFVNDGVEIGAGGVDGASPAGRAGADDDDFFSGGGSHAVGEL